MDAGKYLKRIGFDVGDDLASVRPDLATLRRIQNCHLTSVPFENLDHMAGKEPKLAKYKIPFCVSSNSSPKISISPPARTSSTAW